MKRMQIKVQKKKNKPWHLLANTHSKLWLCVVRYHIVGQQFLLSHWISLPPFFQNWKSLVELSTHPQFLAMTVIVTVTVPFIKLKIANFCWRSKGSGCFILPSPFLFVLLFEHKEPSSINLVWVLEL